MNAGLPDAVVIFPFQRTRLLQNPNKNQEPKTKPASEFGFGLFLRFLPYNLLRFNLLPLCFSLRVFALETANAVPPYQSGGIHRKGLLASVDGG